MARQENEIGIDPELLAFGERYAENVEAYLEGVLGGFLNPLDKNSVEVREDYESYEAAPGTTSIAEIGMMRATLYDQLHIDPKTTSAGYTYPAPKGGIVNVRIFPVNDTEGFEGWELQEHIHPDSSTEFMIGQEGLTDKDM